MKIKYFQDGSRFIAVTDQCPKDFKGILFIGKSGTDPLQVEEGVFTPDSVLKLPEIRKIDMPAAWVLAFNYEKPVAPKKPPVEVVEEFPLFDPETNDLLDYIPVRRPRPTILEFVPNPVPFDTGLIIGLALVVLCLILGSM